METLINEQRLNLACGQNRVEGYFGIDIKPGDTVDAVVDLEQYPWPIESESAEEIICYHYIEHIPHDNLAKVLLKIMTSAESLEDMKKMAVEVFENMPSDGFFQFMDEVYRILKPGGKLKIIAPYYSSIRAWQDPTHQRAINEACFLYLNKDWREANKLSHYNVKADCDFVYGYDVVNEWATRNEEARSTAIKNYNNVANDIHVTLTKK